MARYGVIFQAVDRIFRSGMASSLIIAVMAGGFCALSGCNSDRQSSTDSTGDVANDKGIEHSVEVVQNRTTTVKVNPDPAAESPAQIASLPDSETSPREVCRLFMQYLSSGNRAMAEQMMTPAAVTITSRADLKLQPVGGPNSIYELSEARFATSKKKLCQVECKIRESAGNQQPDAVVTWICRRQKEGWRIAGMIVPAGDDGLIDYLSFENAQDVARIKQSLMEQASTEIERTASRPDSDPPK